MLGNSLYANDTTNIIVIINLANQLFSVTL